MAWVKDIDYSVMCTRCGEHFYFDRSKETAREDFIAMTNYCPKCGSFNEEMALDEYLEIEEAIENMRKRFSRR